MKALSLHQPWASLLCGGVKKVETRSWCLGHRGRLLVHAAARWNDAVAELCRTEPFWGYRSAIFGDAHAVEQVARKEIAPPLGCLIGMVEVLDCVPTDTVAVDDRRRYRGRRPQPLADGRLAIGLNDEAFGNFNPGRYAIVCADPVLFDEPIPFRGRQGIFECPDDIIPKKYRVKA